MYVYRDMPGLQKWEVEIRFLLCRDLPGGIWFLCVGIFLGGSGSSVQGFARDADMRLGFCVQGHAGVTEILAVSKERREKITRCIHFLFKIILHQF